MLTYACTTRWCFHAYIRCFIHEYIRCTYIHASIRCMHISCAHVFMHILDVYNIYIYGCIYCISLYIFIHISDLHIHAQRHVPSPRNMCLGGRVAQQLLGCQAAGCRWRPLGGWRRLAVARGWWRPVATRGRPEGAACGRPARRRCVHVCLLCQTYGKSHRNVLVQGEGGGHPPPCGRGYEVTQACSIR